MLRIDAVGQQLLRQGALSLKMRQQFEQQSDSLQESRQCGVELHNNFERK